MQPAWLHKLIVAEDVLLSGQTIEWLHCLNVTVRMQMFARKYQRIASNYASKGAIFLEILGDETSETRVRSFPVLPLLLLLW